MQREVNAKSKYIYRIPFSVAKLALKYSTLIPTAHLLFYNMHNHLP